MVMASPSDNSHEYDDEPELAGYEPHGDRPLRSPHLLTVMRVVVVVGLIGLVLPGILIGVSTANNTAQRSCEIYTSYLSPEAVGFSARFELASESGIGWNCYAVGFGGSETLLATMGLIPGGARLPATPLAPTSET
ncbi:hypothetical protein GCM10007382_15730 [Salinibacterium xinjiangense]|nr:hypothetical protein GCM10007382_15730 [Salinibacterium xinjiangense]